MAKKSATYLDYEVIVEDNNSITVKKGGQHIPNVMGAIREIASITGYVINEKSNTRQNGAKLVDYLKTLPAEAATPAPEAEAAPVPSVEPTPTPEAAPVPSVEPTPTPEAAPVPSVEPTPAPEPTPVVEPEPVPEPEPSAPETAPAPQATPAEPVEQELNQTTETNELSEEEMKQIDDLIKRLETLEARIAKLESGAVAAPASGQQQDSEKLTVIKEYKYYLSTEKYDNNGLLVYNRNSIKHAYDYYKRYNSDENIKNDLIKFISDIKQNISIDMWGHYSQALGHHIRDLIIYNYLIGHTAVLLSNNKIYLEWFKGSDLNDLKTITTLLNIEVPKGTRKDKLALELVAKYGDGKRAVISGYLVTIDGTVYSLEECKISDILNRIHKNDDVINEFFNVTVPLKISDSKTSRENLDSIHDYIQGLTQKIKPASPEAQAEEFERVAKEVFHLFDIDL